MQSDERTRALRYRNCAAEYRANAAKTKDLSGRPGPIQFAQLCEILADSIESCGIQDPFSARMIESHPRQQRLIR
jgi:hypothetical protein